MHVHCEKTSPYTTFWLTWMCSHENDLIEARVCIQLVAQFPMLCSTDMFPRSVSTTRRIHVLVHTLKDGCLYTFLTYEVMHMRNFKHITPCLSHNFPQVQSKQSTTFWLTRTSPCANCHIWGRVSLQRVTKFLTFYLNHHVSTHCVDYVTCLCVCSRTKKTCLHTSRIRKTCTCVTFNTWHPVCHIISHWCTWNEIQPRDF